MHTPNALPAAFSRTDPTTPLSEIPRVSRNRPRLSDLPFSMGELDSVIGSLRSFSSGYVAQIDEIRGRARRFCNSVVRPRALQIERAAGQDSDYFAEDVMREACDYGMFSFLIPKGFGGGGFLSLHSAVMAEELAVGCAGLASTIGVHSAAMSIALLGMDAYLLGTSIQEVIEAERRREPILWAGAVTEPAAGTDIWDEQFLGKGAIGTFARKVPGGYRISGRKCFISNGSVAKEVVLVAALDRKNIAGSWTGFLVPADAEGFSVGRIEKKMGQKSSPTAELILDDVFVSSERQIGQEGGGARYVSIYLSASRGPVGAIGTGVARRALECLIDWAKQADGGAGPMIDQQWLQLEIAEMARDICLSRQAYMSATVVVDSIFIDLLERPLMVAAQNFLPLSFIRSSLGRKVLRSDTVIQMMSRMLGEAAPEQKAALAAALGAMAKIQGSNTGVRVAGKVMRIMGHDSYDRRWPVDKCYRDAKLTQIYEGTNEANAITQFKAMAGGWSLLDDLAGATDLHNTIREAS